MSMLRYVTGAIPGKPVNKPGKQQESSKRYEAKRERTFVSSWQVDRDWLKCSEDGTMLDTIKKHEQSKLHIKVALQKSVTNISESPAAAALFKLKQADYARLAVKFRTAHAIAKYNKSFRDYTWICRLDKVKGVDLGTNYINDKAAATFVENIARVSEKKVIEHLQTTKFFSFTCDGSTDYTGEELETIYLRTCHQGEIHDSFLNIGSPESGCSADIHTYITSVFDDNGVHDEFEKKLVGFCSDGASNMQGNKNGLAALLRRSHPHIITIHCLAHRLKLSFKDIVKANSLYEKTMTLLLGLYYLYRKSPKTKKGLQRSFEAMSLKQILPTRVGGTRWLPHLHRAIIAFSKGYRAIRAHLETASHGNPKAEGLGKLAADGNIIVFIMTLKVLISPLVKLSLSLQRDKLTLADACVHLTATRDVVSQIHNQTNEDIDSVHQNEEFKGEKLVFRGRKADCKLETLANNILQCMENRIPLTPILSASSLTNLCNWPDAISDKITDYGNAHVATVTAHFSNVLTEAGVEIDDIPEEWQMLKALMYKKFSSELADTNWATVNRVFSGHGISNILTVIDLLQSLPPTSVKNEQVFSVMKLTKGKRRGQLKNQTLNSLLTISLDKTDIETFDPKESIEQWMITPSGRKRRVGGYQKQGPLFKKPKTDTSSSITLSEEELVAEPNDAVLSDSTMDCNQGVCRLEDDGSDDDSDCDFSENDIENLLTKYTK